MAKRKYKRLHYEDRQTIEAMSKQGTIFLATSVTKKLDHNTGRLVCPGGRTLG